MLIRSLFITFLWTHLYSILAWKFSSHLILVCVPAGQTLLKPSKILISILFKTAATCQSLLIKAAHKLEQRKHSRSTQKAYYIMTPGYKGSNVERKEKKKKNEKKKKTLAICQYQEEAESCNQNRGEILYFNIAGLKQITVNATHKPHTAP